MHHRVVEKDAFTVAGKKARVPLQYEGVNPGIHAFVTALPQELHARIAALSYQQPAGVGSRPTRYRAVDGPELLRMDLADDQSTATCELWIPIEAAV